MSEHGPHRTIPYRRKREGKTDYKHRAELLRSGKPRLIVRISLKNVRAQVARPAEGGDEILASAFSKELKEWDYKGAGSNTPAAYLTGFVCGYRAKEEGIEECVLDIDRFVPTPESKIFAVLKGALDAGLYVPHDESVLPSEERCRGEHIANYGEILKSEDENQYESHFSNYLEEDLPPEDLPEHFKQVKEAITTQYGE